MTPQEMRADPDNKYQIADWAARIVRDFTARMPDGIDWTVVLHLDESHVHIHILAINTPDPKLDANKLHVGKCAAARWRDCNDSDVIAPLPKPELIPRPLKPRKERPSKNRQTQAKRDARHAEAVVAWEESCPHCPYRRPALCAFDGIDRDFSADGLDAGGVFQGIIGRVGGQGLACACGEGRDAATAGDRGFAGLADVFAVVIGDGGEAVEGGCGIAEECGDGASALVAAGCSMTP
jgi:hypothetical protein